MAESSGRQLDGDNLGPVPENIGVGYLPDSTNLSSNTLLKGTNYYVQGYIHDVKVFAGQDGTTIIDVQAKCWRSMRKSEPPHKLNISIGPAQLTESFCSCKIGRNGKCSHIVGLLKTLAAFKLHGFERVPQLNSCTSMPQQWHVPRGEKLRPVPLNRVVVARPTETPRKRQPIICSMETDQLPEVSDQDLQEIQKHMSGTPLEYILPKPGDPPIPRVVTPMGQVPLGCPFSYQAEQFQSPRMPAKQHCTYKEPAMKDCPVTLPSEFEELTDCSISAEQIEINTRDQSACETWFMERRGRITASNFGLILKRKSPPSDSFLRKVLNYCGAAGAASLDYGKRHERHAKEEYLRLFPNRHIHDVGLVISTSFSFLGASPDGVVCDNGQTGIIEIKCPYKCRMLTIDEACKEVTDFYLDSQSKSLQTSHEYYAQVQGQLMITGQNFCDFIVFTQKDTHVERIFPDIPFMQDLLKRLATFYKNYALAYISNQKNATSP